jgi:hypothetical protein
MEGFRISIQALKLILREKQLNDRGLESLEIEIPSPPQPSRIKLKPLNVTSGPDGVSLGPQIHPMRTREQALRAHREKYPEMYNEDGTRKGFEKKEPTDFQRFVDEEMKDLERATRPDPPPVVKQTGYKFKGPTGKARKIDDEGRDVIRRRAQQARLDNLGKHPKGWVKRVAEEYDVSDALIYQIIYSDPSYIAVPKP